MKISRRYARTGPLLAPCMLAPCMLALCVLATAAGCQQGAASLFYSPPPPPPMLGSVVDQLGEAQEHNGEVFKYIVHQHEFDLNDYEDGQRFGGWKLNEYGEDHVKKIAENVKRGVPYPVVIERNNTSVKDGTKFAYPVHFDPDLDMKRRAVVVKALTRLGVTDAEQRVVVAPSFAQSITGREGIRAYYRGLRNFGGGGGGFGGGFGGGGFGGGF